jgi:uncharacterized membrane protein
MSKNNSGSGTSIVGLLGIAFVVLKLANIIDWSWWYVTLPFWGGFVLLIIVLLVHFIIAHIRKTKNTVKKARTKSKFQTRLEEMAKERNN